MLQLPGAQQPVKTFRMQLLLNPHHMNTHPLDDTPQCFSLHSCITLWVLAVCNPESRWATGSGNFTLHLGE